MANVGRSRSGLIGLRSLKSSRLNTEYIILNFCASINSATMLDVELIQRLRYLMGLMVIQFKGVNIYYSKVAVFHLTVLGFTVFLDPGTSVVDKNYKQDQPH